MEELALAIKEAVTAAYKERDGKRQKLSDENADNIPSNDTAIISIEHPDNPMISLDEAAMPDYYDSDESLDEEDVGLTNQLGSVLENIHHETDLIHEMLDEIEGPPIEGPVIESFDDIQSASAALVGAEEEKDIIKHGVDWVTQSEYNHTVGLAPAGSSPDFVHNLSLQESVESLSHTTPTGQDTSTQYQKEAGQALYAYVKEMAGKKGRTKARGKRKTSKRTKRASKSTSSSKDVQGYLNPFLDYNQRIPDGQTHLSLPHRYNNIFEWAVPTGKLGHMVVVPGRDCGCMYWTSDTSGANPTGLSYQIFSNNRDNITGGISTAETLSARELGRTVFSTTGDVVKWRTVSQGLRMALTNATENNAGWFECAPAQFKMGTDQWVLRSPANNHTGDCNTGTGQNTLNITGNEAYIRPSQDLVGDFISTAEVANIAEEERYRAGTLRSIAATAFTLPVLDSTHAFNDIDEYYAIGSTFVQLDPSISTGELDAANVTLLFARGENDCKKMIQSSVDNSHDVYYIRIHPDDSVASKFLCQLTANHEYVYDVESVLHKHMTPTPIPVPMEGIAAFK